MKKIGIGSFFKASIICAAAVMLTTGCSTKIQTKKEIGSLKFDNTSLMQMKQENKTIATIDTSFSRDSNFKQQARTPSNQFEAMMMARMAAGKYSLSYDFNAGFNNMYAKRLSSALNDSIKDIVSKKGFKTEAYDNFDDMTYQDKKKVYLTFIPKVKFHIQDVPTKKERHRLYSHSEGNIMITGSFSIEMVEPMTKQVFLKKRIKLDDLNINEPYVYQKQISTGNGGLIGTAIDKGTAPERLVDNTDVALTKAINKFYAKAIEKINKHLDKEELLSYEEDILKLKGLKRF